MLGKLNFHVTRVSVFLIPVALIVGMAGSDGVGGGHIPSPRQNSPSQNLEIRTWYDLDAVRNNLAGNHTLMNDLDSTTSGYEELASPIANQWKGWQPIGFVERIFWDDPCGGGGSRTDWYGLNGTFDGQGYEIRDLFINRPDQDHVGLFGVVDEGGVIKDIGAMNVTVIGDYYVGGLVGWNSGTVSSSYSTGNVNGSSRVGGLVGINDGGTVSNAYYNYDKVLINGENIITIGALFCEDFEEWLANDRFLDVNERLSQENGYYLINDVTDFKELLPFGQDGSLKFRLTNDLDLGDEPSFYIPYLAGEFDGNGHKIANLSLNCDLVWPLGLFGYLAPGGRVTHVGVENVNITGYEGAGGLVGFNNWGTVSDSYSTGGVTGDYYVGGLVGWNSGTVSDSYSTGSVTGVSYAGGLVGFNLEEGTVSNSYSTGSVTGSSRVGGLVGINNGGTVSDSYSSGNVTGYSRVGGLVGWNTGTVSDSYSTGNVNGNEYVGGLVGWNYQGTVSKSYSTGNVNGNEHVGGLVGWNYQGTVSNSFWDTKTSGKTTSAGGIGKTTVQMKNIATFSSAGWNIIAVANADARNRSYIWNIVDEQTYPFLSWQS
jgi:hypothetical protein